MHAVTSPAQWAEQLRDCDLRATEGRLTALSFIETHQHSTANDIYLGLVSGQPTLSQQSVHNIVNDLTAAGLLRRIDLPENGSALFETRTLDNHHHVQCIRCLQVQDVDCAIGEAPCLHPSDTHGMRIIEANVVFRGICATCENEPPHHPLTKGSDSV